MRSRSVRALVVCAALFAALTVSPRADTTAQPLTFFENWNDVTRISAANNWNDVHGIIGYRGDGMVSSTGVNPQGVIADGSGTPVNVMANQTNPNTNTTGGIAEFEIADPVVALQGSGTARAPHVVMTLTTVGQSSIHVSYNLRDVDNSTDNAISPVALQYRVGTSGSYTNVPGAFVADASVQAPATLVTPVSVDLPAAVANQPVVQLRIITTDAAGSDEWIGIDDIRVTGTTIAGDTAPAITATSPTNLAANVAVDSPISITFSEPVAAGSGAFALQCGGTAQAFETSASPSDTFVLTPLPRLPFARNCTVTVFAAQIADVDLNDPPDTMAGDFTFSFTTVDPPPQQSNAPVVISQIYGGGGNSNATYRNDYVELFNRGSATIDLTGWSLQYASATGDSWNNWQPLGGPIAPGERLLVALASGGNVGAALPAANVTGSINMGATSGKIALVNSFMLLEGACPVSDPSVMDLVGYGTSANCREGSTNAPAPSNTLALFRRGDGGTDTDRNGNDFTTGAPNAQRTAPIVELGPVLLLTDPARNQINVPRDGTIAITFTEPVDVDAAWFRLTCATSGDHTDATFASNAVSQYITPNHNFTPGELCTMTVFKNLVHDVDTDDGQPNTDSLLSDETWSFRIATGAAPAYPPEVHLTMGNPSGAVASTTEPNNFLMEKPEYALSYNRDYGRPNWVSWHLSDEWTAGNLTRVDTFRPDPAIPADWYRVQAFDFFGTGFDRGHMTPNADRDNPNSIPTNQATFLMSNMVAQAPGNNQGPWASLESFLRTLLPANELYIVAGPAGIGGTGSNGGQTTTVANGHVAVPHDTWKVALVLPKNSGNDIDGVTCSARTIAVIMPNEDGIRSADWQTFETTVDDVESLTGYNFFSNLPEAVQRCVERIRDNDPNKPTDPRNVSVFSGFAPSTLEAGSASVEISGTIGAGGVFPAGQVTISLGGATTTTTIGVTGTFSAQVPATALVLGGGPYVVSFTYAGDANFTPATATSTLTVVDTTAPSIADVTRTPGDLGSPNHKMVDVTVGYSASDIGSAPSCSLSVSSNEPVNGLGDGNTSADWKVINAHRVQVRAERSGLGTGRVYSIAVTCRDAAGNRSTATATVSVTK